MGLKYKYLILAAIGFKVTIRIYLKYMQVKSCNRIFEIVWEIKHLGNRMNKPLDICTKNFHAFFIDLLSKRTRSKWWSECELPKWDRRRCLLNSEMLLRLITYRLVNLECLRRCRRIRLDLQNRISTMIAAKTGIISNG